MNSAPSVSIIIPAHGSANSLPAALASVRAQGYPRIIEVVVAAADEASADAARAEGATVVDNPTGTTPAGLNLALAATTGDVIVRCDAHAILPPDYVEKAVAILETTGADNVGGMQVPSGVSYMEKAIAAAMASPFGAGGARYRIGGVAGPTETVYLGVFRREAVERLGGYDESFLRTQDYELNHRIIEGGGLVWFDPTLRVMYRPRASLRALARQYFLYGGAKRLFARKHPGKLKLRQLAAPVLVAALAVAILGALVRPALLVVPGAYLLGLIVAGLATLPSSGWSAFAVPLALAVMHLSWGAGFLLAGERSVPVQELAMRPDIPGADRGGP